MPPNWFFRMAELQAISNVSDEDLIAIVAEKGPTKAQKFEKMVKSVARTTVAH
jgi:succinate dehydrogenase flavin-adding protein (antitoxin of CptAB toxin-antitoxin module)